MSDLSAEPPVTPPAVRTRPSLVLLARAGAGPAAEAAVQELSLFCYGPLLAFARYLVEQPGEAAELVHGFLADFLQRQGFRQFTYEKHGSLRAWLRVCLRNYHTGLYRAERAQKRGSGQTYLAGDARVEPQYLAAVDPGLTPEEAFDRRWMQNLIARSLARVEADFPRSCATWLGRGTATPAEVWESLQPLLMGEPPAATREVLAAAHGLTLRDFISVLTTTRQQLRQDLKEELRNVAGPDGWEAELEVMRRHAG